jgi:two-component system, NarL family, sensor histidine kinase DesK
MCFSLCGFATLIDALKRHAMPTELALTGVGIALFIATFYLILRAWKRGGSGLWQTLAITLLGALFAPFNNAAWLFFAVACAFAAVVADGQARQVSGIVAAILATALAEKVLVGLPWSFVSTIAGVGIPIAVMCTLTIRRAAAVRELARHGERERIARDMHDVLGHTLSVIILKIDLASRLARTDPERVIRELADVDRIARATLDEVRATLQGYRARTLQHELELARHALTAAGIAVTTDFAPLELDPAREGALCLALREAITNVVRHSQARHCRVAMSAAAGQCILTIEDDGQPEEPGAGDARQGSGLEGMRERLASLGGSVARRVDRGTTLTIVLPPHE